MTWEEMLDSFEMSGSSTSLENSEETSFTWAGCDCCNNGLGNEVYDCKLHKHDYTGEIVRTEEINLCGECLYAYHYGE
jgi:hypothetical protein